MSPRRTPVPLGRRCAPQPAHHEAQRVQLKVLLWRTRLLLSDAEALAALTGDQDIGQKIQAALSLLADASASLAVAPRPMTARAGR